MKITAKKIYRDYILKALRRRFIRYAVALIVMALAGVPLFSYIAFLSAGLDAGIATVSNIFDGGFTMQFNSPANGSNTFITYTGYPLPVYKTQIIPVYFEGDKVTVNALPQILSMIFLLWAGYYILKALYFVYLKAVNKKNTETLKTEGKLLLCDIDRIEKKRSVFKNFKVFLKYTDVYGMTHYFETEKFYFDPNIYLEGDEKIKVYTDPTNYKLYHIEMPEHFPQEPWHYYY